MDIGPLEFLTLAVMAIVIFGPDKLPKLIQDTMGFIRKVRAFADSAKEDIRSELGPEFQNFEFEDLHPKTFVRKQLLGGNEDAGSYSVGVAVDLYSKYRFDLKYVDFLGDTTLNPAGAISSNGGANSLLTDRGFVVFTFKTTL